MLASILIIDKRKELPAKYKKSLENEQTSVIISGNLKDAMQKIQLTEPDIIIVSDSIEENLANFCNKIRVLTFNTRPVIIALSKSAESSDRIQVLENGADDFLSEPVNIDEFKIRIKAHLRRDIESNLDNKTLLPNKKFVNKALKRILNSDNKYAILMLSIENLSNYKSVYSELAGDKLVQTLIAITKSALDTSDFLGQINDTNFIIITGSYSAEKLAAFLTFAFDTVAPKFYSSIDAKRGYMLLKGDRMAGMRVNPVSILIGGFVSNYDLIKTPTELIEKLNYIKRKAKVPSGSNYLIDRIKLTGENSVQSLENNNAIYINEPDDALALLLRTTLELQGYDVADTLDFESSAPPKIIILDSGNDMSGLEICKDLKGRLNFVDSKIIVTSNIHDKITILDAGADLYLPKPYEISDLIQWVEYFMKENRIS